MSGEGGGGREGVMRIHTGEGREREREREGGGGIRREEDREGGRDKHRHVDVVSLCGESDKNIRTIYHPRVHFVCLF